MKKVLSALLALCLISALPAAAEPVSQAVEAPVAEAWTAGEGNGLSVEIDGAPTGEDFTAPGEAAGPAGVAADDGDAVFAVGPDEAVPALDEFDLGAAQAAFATPTDRAEANAGVERAYPGPEDSLAIEGGGDPDALFAGYVRRILYGSGRPVLMATNNAGRQLSGMDRLVYKALREAVIQIAEGGRASTVVEIPIAEALGKTAFTAAELGVEVEYDENNMASADSYERLKEAFQNLQDWDFQRVSEALWCDCVYELYWFDRYKTSIRRSGPGYWISYDADLDDLVVHVAEDSIAVRLPVLAQYAGDGEYTADPGVIAGAKQAAANARAIVSRYANCSDYAKLYGYAVEICRLVSYNHAAAEAGWELTEQNPWKLIWVFDDDPDTNVVCEGYAMAFQYLCELTSFDTGVRCYLVDGVATEAHAWNIVRMDDGRYYAVDVTWMDLDHVDALAGSLADWINDESVGGPFLVGGSGSIDGGYTIQYRDGGSSYRRYSEETRAAYPADVLTLAAGKYVPNGFMRIDGNTFFFSDGRFLTGVQVIDGVSYDFGTDGVLAASWTPGWHTIGGRDYYFDANGLHTEHTVETVPAVPPTCTEDGLTEGKRCSVCKVMLVDQDPEPALGHQWGDVEYLLSGDGSSMTARRACLRDESHVDAETVATTAAVFQAPTCTQRGKTAYTAVFRNRVFKKQVRTLEDIPAPGHTPVADKAVAPTCARAGKTAGEHCAACGKVLVRQKTVPKLISVAGAKVTVTARVYTGKAIKPGVTVTLKGKALTRGTDYTVSYSNNVNIGKAAVTIRGKGKYGGVSKAAFRINPAKVTGLSLTAGKKRLTVAWKQAAGITGYQIEYSRSSAFKTAQRITVNRNAAVKAGATVRTTLGNLRAKRKYYVRIRAYRKVGDSHYYSDWSRIAGKYTT